jgi:hypothetical protein
MFKFNVYIIELPHSFGKIFFIADDCLREAANEASDLAETLSHAAATLADQTG